ncbi:hypothetical protein AWC38_SpisGene21601 [Stylophora pistillata]|uniref:Uncharacterized protein n=1 Tax=Stylophora pistillata TaxID=50429 RepID=A0A2B4R7D1_STYPI|nr:hypothetical protein AWC38_SpisGene21601 [Stylophora pistillata]
MTGPSNLQQILAWMKYFRDGYSNTTSFTNLGVHIVSSVSVGTEPTGPVAMVALMGDPMVVFERLISGLESASALKKIERGHCPGDEVKATEGVTNLLICF